MTKTLLILRHAKAQPDAPAGDRARELTDRGLRNAAAIGAHLRARLGCPDAIVTSDAQRARHTAELVAAACGFTAPLDLDPQIYGADIPTLLQVVRRLPESTGCVLLVGHNPGLEEVTAALAGPSAAVRLPTAGLVHLEFDVARWSEVRPGLGRFRGLTTRHDLA
jgi:phosphohistidine phosphatase